MWVRVPSGLLLFLSFSLSSKQQCSFIYLKVVSCLIRLAVRTPRCGRGNPGSNPGLDTFLYVAGLILEFSDLHSDRGDFPESPSSSVGRAPAF